MRVLTVGSMYPPHSLGGYEQVWRSAVEHLRSQGHEVRVLATGYRRSGVVEAPEEGVHRELRWYWRDDAFPRLGVRERLRLERHNAALLARHLGEFGPDVVGWWAMGGMSLSLIDQVSRAGVRAVGFVHDDWMVYGPQVDQWLRLGLRLPRNFRAPISRIAGVPVSFDPGNGTWVFVSEFIRRRALERWSLGRTGVAHSGIAAELYRPVPPGAWGWRILSAGRVEPRKGVETAIRALPALPGEATLRIVGPASPDYLDELRRLAASLGVGERISFAELARDELPAAYAEADAVVFPVVWEEPWGLVPLEAMAVGRPVVATGRGGSSEYLRDGENALLFDSGDSAALAAALSRLATDEGLRARLRAGGAETAVLHTEAIFNEAVESWLGRAAGRERSG